MLTVDDPGHFREVLSHFCSGVVVVTGVVDGAPAGMTCQSFASLSLDPPLVLFCPARSSTSWPVLSRAEVLCINVLSGDQQQLSNGFARSGSDKFADVVWTPTPRGAPALDGAAAHLEVCVQDVFDGGDHQIVTCQVVSLQARGDAEPLLYYRSGYRALGAQPQLV
ncbi:MAG: flavin reductase domain protein FMN-binding protein [Frankiales bacterium]|nr:flavin reductase domain protein FMN-binding protein [Frankiales bacterium]